jgi:hypothetical protein
MLEMIDKYDRYVLGKISWELGREVGMRGRNLWNKLQRMNSLSMREY